MPRLVLRRPTRNFGGPFLFCRHTETLTADRRSSSTRNESPTSISPKGFLLGRPVFGDSDGGEMSLRMTFKAVPPGGFD